MIFSHFSHVPKPAINLRLGLSVLVYGFLGASRGFDEGIISGTVVQKAFINSFNPGHEELDTNVESNIVSMVQIACVGGSLFAFLALDRIGRKLTALIACLIWLLGFIVVLTSSGNLGQLYAGRFVAGLGVGMTVTCGPAYLAEVSPSPIRGACVCAFSGSVYIGILLGYFSNYGTARHISDTDDNQWLIPNSLNIIAAGLTFIGALFTVESPRYWIMKGNEEKALETFSYLRKLPKEDPYVQSEFQAAKQAFAREVDATKGRTIMGAFKELFTVKANLYRIMLGIGTQLLGQWSGGGSFTVYAPKIFALVNGNESGDTKLFTTGIFGIVKLVSSLAAAFFLVDMIGRKRSVCIGITLQCIAALYIGVYLHFALNVSEEDETASMQRASTGAIFMIYLSGFAWAIGWNSVQYLINAEIFPLNVRSLGVSIVMGFHFVNQYGNSRAFNPMIEGMSEMGTFLFFAAECFLSLAWVIFFLPETSSRSLEELDELFNQPWYKIGRNNKVFRRTAEEQVYDANMASDVKDSQGVEQVFDKRKSNDEKV